MQASPHLRLAIVEDSDEDFAVFMRIFRDRATITRWRTGEVALRAFEQGDPSLAELTILLVDLNLPGIDGSQVIERVRALEGGQALAVCVLSSSNRPEDRERAFEAGADAYLIKPDDIAGLRALPGRIDAIIAAR